MILKNETNFQIKCLYYILDHWKIYILATIADIGTTKLNIESKSKVYSLPEKCRIENIVKYIEGKNR